MVNVSEEKNNVYITKELFGACFYDRRPFFPALCMGPKQNFRAGNVDK
jgi:hypothetical protein